jgi:IclR family transcriptional regulator, KDG regulon repressor
MSNTLEKDRNSPTYRVSMAAAAVEVLEAFKCSSEMLTLADIARCTSVSKPTIFRILHTLQHLGYVQRDIDSGRYFLSLKILEFAKYVRRANTFRLWALPYMRRLMKQFDLIVNLAIREGGSVSYVEIITPASSQHVPPRIGATARLHSTALGKAIASYLPEAEVREVIKKHGMSSVTPHTITDIPVFLSELEHVRKQGYAEDNQENLLGIVCLAAPIRDATGKSIGAISVTSTPQLFTAKRKTEVAEALKRLGQDLSLRVAGNLALSRFASAQS